ncbi:hypothetical protein ACNF40_01185 [Cuniculiplasma sp. SKW4]|uniref:hypothetical protein n=1 Tax=Cuniculiplasma sp. SKW4 TaxID=3400171 RepID=UPI003FD00D44
MYDEMHRIWESLSLPSPVDVVKNKMDVNGCRRKRWARDWISRQKHEGRLK